jgi:hypothetical protein
MSSLNQQETDSKNGPSAKKAGIRLQEQVVLTDDYFSDIGENGIVIEDHEVLKKEALA